MGVTVTDPLGGRRTAQGKSPLTIKTPNAPRGRDRAMVRGVDVRGGEPHSVSFATDAACVEGNVDTGGGVLQTLSNSPISKGLSQSGGTGGTPQVPGAGPNSAPALFPSELGCDPGPRASGVHAHTPHL